MNVYLKKTTDLSKVTKHVVDCFNTMNHAQFMNKFACSKETYLKRFIKYGDPYMKAPLARIGKLLKRIL